MDEASRFCLDIRATHTVYLFIIRRILASEYFFLILIRLYMAIAACISGAEEVSVSAVLQQAEEAFKVTPYDKLPPKIFHKNDTTSAEQAAVASLAQPASLGRSTSGHSEYGGDAFVVNWDTRRLGVQRAKARDPMSAS